MESALSNEIVIYIIVGTLAMFSLALSIILIVFLAQRKVTKQNQEMQEREKVYQKNIFRSVLNTQEEERKRIAKDLHDEIGTSLYAANNLGHKLIGANNKDIEKFANEIIVTIDSIIKETRKVINDLSPSILKKFGLFNQLNELSKQLDSIANVKLQINSNVVECRFNDELELSLYRIIKEFCNNTIKYANATNIILYINSFDDKLEVNIVDDGKGFVVDEKKGRGHGLMNMESRIYLLGGEYKLISSIGAGTELQFELPLNANDIKGLNTLL